MWICYVCERCSAIYGSSVGGKCALDVQSVRDDVRNELDMGLLVTVGKKLK